MASRLHARAPPAAGSPVDGNASTSATPALNSLGLQSDEDDDDVDDALLAGARPQHDVFDTFKPATEPKPVALTGKNLSCLVIPKRKPKEDVAASRPAKQTKTSHQVMFRGVDFKNSLTSNNLKKTVNDAQVNRNIKQKLRMLVEKIVKYNDLSTRNDQLLTTIRELLAELPLDYRVNEATLIDSDFMTPNGIRKLFYVFNTTQYPHDVVEDALAMYARWDQGNYDHDMFRGLTLNTHTNADTKSSKQAWKMQENYPYRVPGNNIGANRLQNGQWWPLQLCAFRDGAVASHQSGISINKYHGAVAVVISADGYDKDEDHGNQLWYCGTKQENEAKAGEVTNATRNMDVARTKATRIRVLRSAGKGGQWAPKVGIRYDGLYTITDSELVDESKQLYRYRLIRVPGQGPIRNEGEAARPNKYEVEAYNRFRNAQKIYS